MRVHIRENKRANILRRIIVANNSIKMKSIKGVSAYTN